MKLNDSQMKAAMHFKGPMIVIAGPGSGKTAVITQRTLNLIKKYNVPAKNILVITFTKSAAVQMKERFLSNSLENCNFDVTFSTLHSLFYKILHYFCNLKTENIISEENKYEILLNIIDKLNIKIEDKKEFINKTILNISNAKIGEYDIKDDDEFKNIYNGYSKILKSKRLLDFDDLMLYCYRLLISRPDILKMCQNKYQYIMVDEFQDICAIQYKIIRLISYPLNNLFIVGDDDQSIYSFRGAKPSIMLNFPKDYENTKKIFLNTNYRSGSKIITAAIRVISHNKLRFKKDLNPANNLKKDDKIFLVKTENLQKQNQYIIDKIKESNSNNYSDFAILFRTNKEQTLISSSLLRYNIPFISKDTCINIFNTMTISDMMSYFRAAFELNEYKKIKIETFLKIMNKPVRYIERNKIKDLFVDIKLLQKAHIEKPWTFSNIIRLSDDLKKIVKLKPVEALKYIRENVGYDKYIIDYAMKHQISSDDFLEQLDEFSEICTDIADIPQLFEFVDNYNKKLITNNKNPDKIKNAVTLSTFHSSKGLEFKNIFIVNCLEDIIPYKKAISNINNKETIEEERRLFYVALTRAKKSLYLIIPNKFYAKTKKVSRFLKEMANISTK